MVKDVGGWYALIDCSRDTRLEGLVASCRERACLFKGKIDPQLANVAPWLVRIDEQEALMSTWQLHGRGQSWGLMALSQLSLDPLQRFFRRFLQAMLPDGMVVTFRFYDPRVFNTFICAAEQAEREPWFEGVEQYAVEAEGGEGLHQYRLTNGKLYDGEKLVG